MGAVDRVLQRIVVAIAITVSGCMFILIPLCFFGFFLKLQYIFFEQYRWHLTSLVAGGRVTMLW